MLIFKMTPSCEVVAHHISESLDHQLSFYNRMMVRLHTLACVLCKRYRQQLLAMEKMLQDAAHADPEQFITEAHLDPQVLEKIKEEIKKQL